MCLLIKLIALIKPLAWRQASGLIKAINLINKHIF